ncbi:MAG: 4a-hydroxytetrahydrobiopterin dehydratase [Proteobacteria bacterium]|nr:4a-hydroxytetrahydrobiopterin dehydratase [Pseudomonadota bacterium]
MPTTIPTFADLASAACAPLHGPEHAISTAQAQTWIAALPGWRVAPEGSDLRKEFRFPDFVRALAFVNALGDMAERENHHPDLELGWGRVLVRFSTHDVGGLSRNDFICAAKTEMLLPP